MASDRNASLISNRFMETSSRVPSISVVIPAYNREKLILPTLRSVLNQRRQPIEVIVVDDASPDGTVEVVNAFARENPSLHLRCVVQSRNQGVSAARNRGIREASGEWVAFLDSDDLWEPNHLELMVAKLREDDADIVFARAMKFQSETPDNLVRNWADAYTSAGEIVRVMIRTNYILPSAMMIRRAVLLEHGMFDEDPRMQHAEDADLCWSLAAAGRRFSFVGEYTCRYRQHANSACAQKVKLYQASMQCYQKHRNNPRYSRSDWNVGCSYYQAKLARALHESATPGALREMAAAWIKQPFRGHRAGAVVLLLLSSLVPFMRPVTNRYLNRFV
ncbi:MAG: glycosyltransferase family 2 protein [Verrucomicrobiota bacterium]|nr:glycosyltransferase [Verrucomicrobiaceae bacterium]MDH4451826.1 glycosyltransferase family 2 protein [Verrucomicrobiota bacterium]